MVKEITKVDYILSVYKVIFYIEAHYDQALSFEELAKVGGFSKYHFHRIFKAITNENIGDYLRRIRLDRARWKLTYQENITQIALDSGYETNASFTKAFKHSFNMTPKIFANEFKKRQGEMMIVEPKLVELKPIRVFYVRKVGAYMTSASEAWTILMSFAYEQKIKFHKKIMEKETMHFGIGHDKPGLVDTDLLRYDACISCDDTTIKPQGEVFSKMIEGGKYAVFLHKGAYENLSSTYKMVENWIVNQGIVLRDVPILEKYLNRDPRRTKPENLRTEIYVPIVAS